MSPTKTTTATKTAPKQPLPTTNAKADEKVFSGVGTSKKAVKSETSKSKTTVEKKHKALEKSFIVQYKEKEISYDEVVDRIKALWLADGNKINQIKTMDIYVKPEDEACYYVINGDVQGMISI